MERMVQILELYRDNDDPDLGELDGKSLQTLSRDENLQCLKERGIDGLRLCRLGLIDPRPEFLCRLLHYAIELEETEAGCSTPGVSEEAGPAKKKQKKAPAVTVSLIVCCHAFRWLRIGNNSLVFTIQCRLANKSSSTCC